MENYEPLIEEINKITNFEYKFILKSATLFEDADFCVIEIFYRDGIIFDKSIKTLVEDKIFELVPNSFKYEIHFIKKFISTEQVKSDVENFMTKNYNSVAFKVKEVLSEEMSFKITLIVDTLAIEHAKQKRLDNIIEQHLKNLYEDYSFKCELIQDKVFNNEDLTDLTNFEEDDVDEFEFRKIEYTSGESLIGEVVNTSAMYISDTSQTINDVVICGKIKSINQIIIKRKPKVVENDSDKNEIDKNETETQNDEFSEIQDNEENLEENKNKYERKLFKWVLEDFTGNIDCKILSNKENRPKLETLKVGDEIAVEGKINFDSYSNSNIMNVKKVQFCKLPENFEEFIAYKKEKPFYEFIKPEPIVVYKQDNLLNFLNEEVVPEYLRNKTFVCYDFETTGFHYETGDRIVEIGAVKIVNGKITEKFGSLVNPNGKHIDKGASEVTGIYDEDVADAPKDFEVLQDFYKFTRGSTIIGYNNINFDNVFLLGQGKSCRYNFDNPTEDVYRLAQKYVTGVKNYKLGTIAEKLGVVLDNAHSAVYDALATAEVFLKIAEKM